MDIFYLFVVCKLFFVNFVLFILWGWGGGGEYNDFKMLYVLFKGE